MLPHEAPRQNINSRDSPGERSEDYNISASTPDEQAFGFPENDESAGAQTRDRSISDLCDQLAKSFNREEGPDPTKLIDAGGEQLSGQKPGDVEGSKLKMPRGGACNFSPDFSGNLQAENWNKLRRHENTSQLPNMPEIARCDPSSNLSDIKKGSIVQFKGHEDDDEWHECEVLSRAGRASGKYNHAWNIKRDGILENIDFQRDVRDFQVIRKDPKPSAEHPRQSTVTHPHSNNGNDDIIDVCSSYIANHDSETRSAKEKELQSWKREGVYTEVSDEGQQTMSTTWVVKPKIIDGKYTMKARLCARGFEEDQFFRTDSPTCSREGIRITLATIASNGWTLRSMDVKTAFLQGNRMQRTVYLKPPKEANTKNIWLLQKCVYGLSDASRQWYLRIKEEMIKLGGDVNKLDYGLFTFTINGHLSAIVACFVQDMIYGCTERCHRFITKSLKETFQIGAENNTSFNYVGLKVEQDEDKSITIDQQGYILSIQKMEIDTKDPEATLTSEETTMFRGLVG